MRKNRKRRFGLGNTGSEDRSEAAMSWLKSALGNFERRKGKRSCHQIGHFTDVIAEAQAAIALAPEGSAISKRAQNLSRLAYEAQDEAVHTCRQGDRGAHTGEVFTHTPRATAQIERTRQKYRSQGKE